MKKKNISRRDFLKQAAVGAAGITTIGLMSSCSNNKGGANELFIPGTYTSSQETGFSSVIITCVFSSTAITDVSYKVTESSESDYFKNVKDAAADYCKRIVQANGTVNVDGISGASLSSDAIKDGVNHCTAQALGIKSIKSESIDKSTDETKAAAILPEELEYSSLEMDSIADISEEATFDIVVIGAGASGISAALAAAEDGSKVCVLQKQGTPISQGNLAGYVDIKKTDDFGIAQWIQEQMETYGYTNDYDLIKTYAYKSQEALNWIKGHLDTSGYKGPIFPNQQPEHIYKNSSCAIGGFLFSKTFNDIVGNLESYCTEKGIKFYFNTPAVQLIKDDTKVTGVIGKKKDNSYIKVTAKKGVILSSGDYQNNDAMVRHYVPDADRYKRKQSSRTGDGHLLGMIAGAKIEPIPHCKMIHAEVSGIMREDPLLALNLNGDRFIFNNIDFASRNTVLRYQPEQKMVSLFDANYIKNAKSWGRDVTKGPASGSPEKLAEFVEKGIVLKADTLEDLAAQAGVPVKNLVASVERYNELCATGRDVDFGTPTEYMKPVNSAPFYAQVRSYRVSAIPSGLITDSNCQCLDAEHAQVPGLFAIGNCAGGFFGGVDYSMNTAGISLGRAITFGYVAGKHVSTL